MVTTVDAFGTRLRRAMDSLGPVCAGIDPHASLLSSWGLADSAEGLERFAMTAVEAFASQVAAVKPQSAFFERHGSRGVAVLEKVLAACREAGTLVILDVKRGDIGSTAQAYADAYLDPSSPLRADAVTASPFLGFGSLSPLLDTAERHGGGVFVLALTSNPEGASVQRARAESGRTVAGDVLAALSERNHGVEPLGSFGAVVGATVGDTGEDLAVNGPLLVPGFGAQGGSVESMRRPFATVWENVLVSSSREILSSGPDVSALRSAARRTAEQITEGRVD